MKNSFKRARNDAQREARQEAILQTTLIMLKAMSVSDITLNEISRRAGMAKSNVLRYFDSREAILLVLLNREFENWVEEVISQTYSNESSPESFIAQRLAVTLASRPVLCDLIHSQSAVLERNVSVETVIRHKRAINVDIAELEKYLLEQLPSFNTKSVSKIIVAMIIFVSGMWPQMKLADSVIEAYEQEPSLKYPSEEQNFKNMLSEMLWLLMNGITNRHND
jgi:AcrR family transcriptional regulator